VPFQHGGMNDHILMTMVGHAPVESPFEHGKGLIGRQRVERRRIVKVEVHLRPVPAPQVRRTINADMKVRELSVNSVSCVMQGNTIGE